MAVSVTAVAVNAATVLDLTHAVGERGPKTFLARKRVAHWLDTGEGNIAVIRKDVRWLREVIAETVEV